MRYFSFSLKIILFFLLVHCSSSGIAQRLPVGRNPFQSIPGAGAFSGGANRGPFKDSLIRRTGAEDTITVLYYTLDQPFWRRVDTSVSDFQERWPVPWTSIVAGNYGSAALSLFYQPRMQPGWDHGMHAFDPYTTRVEQTPLFFSSRPYTQLAYILGSKREQTIRALHTQSIRKNWNISVQFNLLHAPGIFKNQKNSHQNILFTNVYQSKNHRYSLTAIIAADKIGASENGGIKNLELMDSLPSFADRFNLPVNFGGSDFQQLSFLSSVITTGNEYRKRQALIRQAYHFGSKRGKDSLLNKDGLTPFKLEHVIHLSAFQFQFRDERTEAESYKNFYGLQVVPDTFKLRDRWTNLQQQLNLYHYPDKRNPNQFLKGGIGVEALQLDTGANHVQLNNLFVSGAYTLQTRNKVWDVELGSTFYTAGVYAGDYHVKAKLRRMIGKKGGTLQIELNQANRTPSFVFDARSMFHRIVSVPLGLRKENNTLISARWEDARQKQFIECRTSSLANYTYFDGYASAKQSATLFSLFQLQAGAHFKWRRYWNWYPEILIQQTIGNAPLNLPLWLTRHRFAFEGRFFKNLELSTGLELRYYAPYKADGYSPVTGQFFYQNDTVIRNRPDITAFLHARIRRMDFFIRVENVNTLQLSPFGFYRNNFSTPLQAMPGLFARLGIFWRFIN